jgi:hypothetical protein
LRCPNKNKKKSQGVESGEEGGCGAIRKKLSLQNAHVTFVVCGLALSARTSNLFHFSLHAGRRSPWEYFGYRRRTVHISPFGMAWHGMESAPWNPWEFQANVSISFGL